MSESAERGTAPRCTDPRALELGSLQSARSLAAGVISGGVVHEFANLLTIVDGQRQMAKLGLSQDGPPADLCELLSRPAQRCQRLVEAYRHLFADFSSDRTELPLSQELHCLEVLISARLRGRATRIEIDPGCSALILPGPGSLAVRLAFLLGLLSVLEHGRAAEGYPERLRLAGRGHESNCRSLIGEFTGFRAAPEQHVSLASAGRLLETAGDLIRGFGGRLSLSSVEEAGDGPLTLKVSVPS